MMNFLSENWGTITIVLLVLIQVINAATKHWQDNKGVVKVLTFISEVFSIVTSKGVVNGSFGKIKAPLTSVKGSKKDEEVK